MIATQTAGLPSSARSGTDIASTPADTTPESGVPKFTSSNVLAAITFGLALAIPPGSLAERLATSTTAAGTLAAGFWLLKAALVAIAGLTAFTARSPALRPVDEPLTSLDPASQDPPGPNETYVVLAVLGVAVGLRIWGLGLGLWYDEVHTLVEYVRNPLAVIVTTFGSQNNHPLYSLAARVSIVVFGESAWALRLPAALFGAVSIWVVYRFGTLITRRREALLAAALLSVSYHHVWFSQNARGYTVLLVWTVVGTWLFVRLLSVRQVTWFLILGYGLAMALAAYTHLTAVLTVVAHAGVWLVLAWRRRMRAPSPAPWPAFAGLAWATVLTFTLYAIVLPQLVTATVATTRASVETAWQDPSWLLSEALVGLATGVPGGWVTVLMGVLVVGMGVASYWRRSPVVISLMVLPGVITVSAAMGLSYNLWPRYVFFLSGFGALIIIRGGFQLVALVLHRRATTWATVGTAVVIAASATTVPRAWTPKQDFSGAARFVDQVSKPNDTVVLVDYVAQYLFQKYMERPWIAVDDLESLESIEDASEQTWLLYTFPVRLPAVYPGIWDRIGQSYDTAAVFPGTVGGGTIYVMVTQ